MIRFENFSLDAHDVVDLSTKVHVSSSSRAEMAFKAVCASETRDRKLSELRCNSKVTIPLLDHQKPALAFMAQKEQEGNPTDFQLWKADTQHGEIGFRHMATGCWTSVRPQEVQSGILADDTGMGKTLSILSLVAETLPNACRWSCRRPKQPAETNACEVYSKATIVVVSSISIMNVWWKEVRDHLDGSMVVENYHGKSRQNRMKNIIDADLVLTTYHTLAAERKSKKPLMNEINWFRIVLDEAHTIRRQATTLFAAVSELNACHRWCLTATPIQNKLEDLGSLLAFIRAEPFDRASMFRKYVTAPFYDDIDAAKKKLALICDSFCLRRNKDRLNFPPLGERIRIVELSDTERVHYEKTFQSMARALSHGSRRKSSGTPFGKFQIWLQLRIICNHGTFQKPFVGGQMDKQTQREDVISSIGKDAEIICSCCRQRTSVLATNVAASHESQSCTHTLCEECQGQLPGLECGTPSSQLCLLCTSSTLGRSITRDQLSTPFSRPAGLFLHEDGVSSKMCALLNDVIEDLWSSKRLVGIQQHPRYMITR